MSTKKNEEEKTNNPLMTPSPLKWNHLMTFGQEFTNNQQSGLFPANFEGLKSGEVATAKLASSASDRAVSAFKDKSIEDGRQIDSPSNLDL